MKIEETSMDSIEGALIPVSKSSFLIIVNSNIKYEPRKNFTLAHEFGHLLCHRNYNRKFECNSSSINKFSGSGESDLETEANDFASQLLIPNNFARFTADTIPFCYDTVADLSARTGSSIVAAALACIRLSSRRIGFAVVTDGFVRWGRASEPAFAAGLYFKSATPVPEGSSAAFEGGDEHFSFPEKISVEGWGKDISVIETGFYSANYQQTYVFLDAG